jgi:hypothetical protein
MCVILVFLFTYDRVLFGLCKGRPSVSQHTASLDTTQNQAPKIYVKKTKKSDNSWVLFIGQFDVLLTVIVLKTKNINLSISYCFKLIS